MAKSLRLYMIRSVYDWAADNGYTPHLLIAADAPGVAVPREFVMEGRITLNISPMAVQNLDLKREPISFFARFNGHPFEVQVPSGAVLAVFARENGEGHAFGAVGPIEAGEPKPNNPPPSGRPKLRVIK